MKLRPMSEFDPTRPALVHDELNDRTFESKPEWADSYREAADPRWGSDGKIGWDGLILDGWRPLSWRHSAPRAAGATTRLAWMDTKAVDRASLGQ
jgi:hypothetical protein